MASSDQIIDRVVENILQPLINLLFVVALLVFFWGMFMMIKNADNEEARGNGKRTMLWGGIGLLIMFGVQGIMAIIRGTFGIPLP